MIPFWFFDLDVICSHQWPWVEKAMAPHSSTLAWKIPWMEEPGRLQSMGSLRVGYNWATSLSLFSFMHWRRKWQPTPVFLPGESQGWGSLVGCHLRGCTESDTTEVTLILKSLKDKGLYFVPYFCILHIWISFIYHLRLRRQSPNLSWVAIAAILIIIMELTLE